MKVIIRLHVCHTCTRKSKTGPMPLRMTPSNLAQTYMRCGNDSHYINKAVTRYISLGARAVAGTPCSAEGGDLAGGLPGPSTDDSAQPEREEQAQEVRQQRVGGRLRAQAHLLKPLTKLKGTIGQAQTGAGSYRRDVKG